MYELLLCTLKFSTTLAIVYKDTLRWQGQRRRRRRRRRTLTRYNIMRKTYSKKINTYTLPQTLSRKLFWRLPLIILYIIQYICSRFIYMYIYVYTLK